MKKAIAALMIIILAFSLTSCGGKEYIPYDTASDDTLLIDYYDAVVGTETDQGSFEVLLKTLSDDYALLETMTIGEGEKEPVVNEYKIPVEAVSEIRKVLEETDMANWHKHNEYGPIDGKALMCNFKYGNEYVQVNADHMPDDGQHAFNNVKEILLRYAKPECLLHYEE